MKNNEPVYIGFVNPMYLIDELNFGNTMPDGTTRITQVIQNIEGPPSDIIGGVGYDYKAMYLYYFVPVVYQIGRMEVYPGWFIRWDDITKRVSVYGAIFIPDKHAHYIMPVILGKQTWIPEDGSNAPKLDVNSVILRLTQVKSCMQNAEEIQITMSEAEEWTKKLFHSCTRSNVISRMFQSGSILDLYLVTGRYYAWKAHTPHMQWWNITMCERLLTDPGGQKQRVESNSEVGMVTA